MVSYKKYTNIIYNYQFEDFLDIGNCLKMAIFLAIFWLFKIFHVSVHQYEVLKKNGGEHTMVNTSIGNLAKLGEIGQKLAKFS